jgi:folate-dependent phosphoribosylglycinamide formyltransferase PurN
MSKTSKSAAIREYLSQHPTAPAKEVAKKFKVTTALVYAVKVKAKVKARKAKREKVVATAQGTNGQVDVVALLGDIKALAEKAGGIKELKKFVDVLAE